MLDLLWAIVWGFVVQSKVLEHVTKRVVDGFGKRPPSTPLQSPAEPVTVFIERLPNPPASGSSIDAADWLIAPIPGRFILASDTDADTSVLGIILDAHGDNPPAISWQPITLNSAIEVSLPANALAAVVASVSTDGERLQPRKIDTFGIVDGHSVFAVRDD
ncbi:hypothetical protein [Amycolatopsis sp. NPDC004169]|uniref:hypothetical protein n=1 Tax=Amycolatopsis sp. NPDC004169 TaxID=3154453 RepID=UPI0033AAF2D4